MAESFGSGTSRTLSAKARAYAGLKWNSGRPPLDSELNLVSQLELERTAELIRSSMPSGFIIDPTQATEDFTTQKEWSNFFKLGRLESDETAPFLKVNVNGWIIPVTGTALLDGDPSNRINLYPPPSSDSRVDFVFLEAWATVVSPNPSTTNKPSSDRIWKYGNTEFGGVNIPDDLEDPNMGVETTERLQIQYRLRVHGQGEGLGASIALDDYPDGLGDPNVYGRGSASAPVSGFTFSNMRTELGDPCLWRAGNGDATNSLGSFDGYVYAIPVCAIFRRNSDAFTAIETGGNPNQNGAFDRNPSAITLTNPRSGAKILGTATLTNAIDEAFTGIVQVTGISGSGLDDYSTGGFFIVLDQEIVQVSAVSASTITIPVGGRGRGGTAALPHNTSTPVQFFNTRPDGKFADEIHSSDILDMRRSVNLGEWDYNNLLQHNLMKLFKGKLHSSYKQSGIGDSQGTTIVEVATLKSSGAVPNQTEALDGPDGIRTVFSDAATLQPDVTMMLSATGPAPVLAATTEWEVGANLLAGTTGFKPDTTGWSNNSVIFLDVEAARGSFRDPVDAVRFISPQEFWKSDNATGLQTPFTLRFISEASHMPAAGDEDPQEHPGPMYPLQQFNFEKPFIVLGAPLHDDVASMSGMVLVNDSPALGDLEIEFAALDFDTAGDWYTLDGSDFADDPSVLANPVLRGERTLYSMLTKNGTDLTGLSSEVYLTLHGETTLGNERNNGAFQVIGAGTVGYTTNSATAADRIRVRPIRPDGALADFALPTTATMIGSIRSQYIHSEDTTAAIVITDIEGVSGGSTNPWNVAHLGALTLSEPVTSKMVLRTALQYHPGHGATARIPDQVWRVATVGAGVGFLRQAPSTLDSTFASQSGSATNETYFDTSHVQTWNRLGSQGLDAPEAPSYGGHLVASTEQDREHEAFLDRGSKTLVFRPYQQKDMTLQGLTLTDGQLIPSNYPPAAGSFAVDGAGLFTSPLPTLGFPIPPEYMPRFGRQDIPYHVDVTGAGSGTFMEGVNHLFVDTIDNSDSQFQVIGGASNGGAGDVIPMFFQTGTGSSLDYAEYGPITPSAVPAYQARLYSNIAITSDVRRGLRGIQLPPFLGIARLYGVYDRRDFEAAPGYVTYNNDRVTRPVGAPPNLLRKDAKNQTLFILQGGASDLTENANDHTYIIPEDALDIRLSNSLVSGESFEDLDYVVECVVFGFSRGWINQNNYVLARQYTATAGPAVGAGDDPSLTAVGMVLPCAAPANTQMYLGYTRTVYQGDPFMTRDGQTQTTSDYENRYGQITQANAFKLATPIQQYDQNGNVLVETPNRRALQVLASCDFYTTLGTGKMGGKLFEGTVTDVGFTGSAHRIPLASTAPAWKIAAQAFTEGQHHNENRATLEVALIDNLGLSGQEIRIRRRDGGVVTLTEGSEFLVGVNAAASAAAIAASVNAAVGLQFEVSAYSDNSSVVTFRAVPVGREGNQIQVAVDAPTVLQLRTGRLQQSTANLSGGVDEIVNAGAGYTPLELTGLTERLPLGILLSDSDFLGEDPLRTKSSALVVQGLSATASLQQLPFSHGEETERLLGVGQWICMADGGVLLYEAFDENTATTGTKRFRVYRGASAFMLSGLNAGGPLDWVSGMMSAELKPVLKGGILAGKALLVRNLHEEAFSSDEIVSEGGEIQMVILTHGIFGCDEGVSLQGLIGSSGFGEGFSASDRYRLEGRPSSNKQVRKSPPLDVELVTYPFNPTEVDTGC